MKEIIYVPALHPSLAPQGLPEALLFVCPGLNCPAGSFVPPGLPFAGREARAVLEELLDLGAAFDAGGDLKLMAGQGWLEREETRKRELRAEAAALDDFARTGSAPGGNRWARAAASGLNDISLAEQFKNAHKALLLAWNHEERIIEMRALEAKIAAGEKLLAAALGDGGKEAAAPAALPPARPEYSWRIVLDALSAFLPEGAALFTAFAPMIDDLRDMGVLEPLPGNMAEAFSGWPEALTHSLLAARLPMWRLLGYAALPADRPWLGAVRELYAAPKLENGAPELEWSLETEQIAAISGIKGIIFDCDGVLLNSRLANVSFYNHLRGKAGLPHLSHAEEEFVHMSTYEQAVDYILQGSDRARVSSYLAEMEDNFDYFNLLKVEDGLIALLDWLAGKGLPLGICTNRLSPLESFLARFGLEGYFSPMQTASNSTPKPNPDGLFKAVDAWGLRPGEVAYIGDSKVDEQAAEAAGMPFWSFKNPQLTAALHIPDFTILAAWLKSYLKA